jgi:hypothetical protein
MNKNQLITSAVAVAVLVAAVAVAQAQNSQGFTTESGVFSELKHDCVHTSPIGLETIYLPGGAAEQTFTACATGEMEAVYIDVLEAIGHGVIRYYILDEEEQVLFVNSVMLTDGFNGLLKLKTAVPVNENQRYHVRFAVNQGTEIKMAGKRIHHPEESLFLNGWQLSGNITMGVGIKAAAKNPEAEDAGAKTVVNLAKAFPNPFFDSITLDFTRGLRGQTEITISDLGGTVVASETHTDIARGDRIRIVTGGDILPGVYAIRISNGQTVSHMTVMKQ